MCRMFRYELRIGTAELIKLLLEKGRRSRVGQTRKKMMGSHLLVQVEWNGVESA